MHTLSSVHGPPRSTLFSGTVGLAVGGFSFLHAVYPSATNLQYLGILLESQPSAQPGVSQSLHWQLPLKQERDTHEAFLVQTPPKETE